MTIIFNKEQNYLDLVNQAAAKYSVDPALLLAHLKQESNFNPNAYRDEPLLRDGSTGIAQILLSTAKSLDPNATQQALYDPAYSIDLEAKLVSKNLARYGGDIKSEIAAYNAGSAMKNAQGQYVNTKGVTNVQNYVDKVYQNYLDYSQWLDNGAQLVDVSIDPWLVGGFAAVLIITIIGSGVFYAKKRNRDRITDGRE